MRIRTGNPDLDRALGDEGLVLVAGQEPGAAAHFLAAWAATLPDDERFEIAPGSRFPRLPELLRLLTAIRRELPTCRVFFLNMDTSPLLGLRSAPEGRLAAMRALAELCRREGMLILVGLTISGGELGPAERCAHIAVLLGKQGKYSVYGEGLRA